MTGAVAMWAWHWASSSELVRFAEDHQVSTVFAYVAPGFTDPAAVPPGWSEPGWPLVTSLVREAAAAGLAVVALGGDPSWVNDPAVAVAWAHEAVGTGLFSGLHLDLEPWVLPTWTTERTGTIRAFLTCLAEVHALAKSHRVPVDVAIPWWLHQHGDVEGRPLDIAAMGHADAVTITTYFDAVTAIEEAGATEVAHAEALGRSFRLAVLCEDVPTPGLTFYRKPAEELQAAMDQVDADMAGSPGYRGMAVEDYASWAGMG